MAANQHFQNQLQFNLNAQTKPNYPHGVFRRPEAIVVEKLGDVPPNRPPLLNTTQVPPAFKFSVVSEDKLSTAIRLARRDLKKQKFEEQVYLASLAEQAKQQENVKQPKNKKSKSKVTQSRYIPQGNEIKRRQSSHERQIVIRERERSREVKNNASQTPKKKGKITQKSRDRKSASPGRGVVLHIKNKDYLPVSGSSPPTRDNEYAQRMQESPNQKHAREINQLRKELANYMQQIRKIEETAAHDVHPSRPKVDELTEEESRRRDTRAGEQASRSARMLYFLQQQVKEVQNELARLGPGKLRHTRKTQTLHRLAAAHRGAVRALQSFVQHLPDQDISHGMPKVYQELALLIRQLSLCCAELEVGGETGVPESVVSILQQATNFSDSMAEEMKRSPLSPKARKAVDHRHKRLQSPVSRQLFSEPRSQKPGPKTVERLRRDVRRRRDPVSSPDRGAVLKAGMEALLRASTTPLPNDTRHQPIFDDHKEEGKSQAWDIPVERERPFHPRQNHIRQEIVRPSGRERVPQKEIGPTKRGILLPSSLKYRREVAQRQVPQRVASRPSTRPDGQRPGHFAVHTHSSKAKLVTSPVRQARPEFSRLRMEVDGEGVQSIRRRSRSAPTTPLRSRLSDFDEHRRSSTPLSERSYHHTPRGGHDDLTKKEIERQVWLDREAARHARVMEAIRQREQERQRQRGFASDVPDQKMHEELVSKAELEIRKRLQPLLSKAQEISDSHADLRRTTQQSLRHQLSEHAMEKVEGNVDLLSDMILSEIVSDTAAEVNRIKNADIAGGESDFGELLKKLDKMEREQDEIRQRWRSLDYGDTYKQHTEKSTESQEEESVELEEEFSSPIYPAPILVEASNPPDPIPYRQLYAKQHAKLVTGQQETKPDQPIIFTKQPDTAYRTQPKPAETFQTKLVNPLGKQKIPLKISRDVLDRIEHYQTQFAKHLKRVSHQAVGKFDPWKLVEEMADEIFSDCLHDIAEEFDDVNSNIVSHIYSTEFNPANDSEAEIKTESKRCLSMQSERPAYTQGEIYRRKDVQYKDVEIETSKKKPDGRNVRNTDDVAEYSKPSSKAQSEHELEYSHSFHSESSHKSERSTSVHSRSHKSEHASERSASKSGHLSSHSKSISKSEHVSNRNRPGQNGENVSDPSSNREEVQSVHLSGSDQARSVSKSDKGSHKSRSLHYSVSGHGSGSQNRSEQGSDQNKSDRTISEHESILSESEHRSRQSDRSDHASEG